MTTEPEKALHPMGVKLSEIGALRDAWHGDEEREAWVNAPLNIVIDLVAAHDAEVSEKARRDALDAIREARDELDKIEDRQHHDIDGMISTIPWAEDVVSGSKRIRRILSRALSVTPEGEKR